MNKYICSLILTALVSHAHALSIDWQTQSGYLSSSGFGWNYGYDIGVFDDVLKVDLNIKLIGDSADQTLLDRWEFGIEDIWSTDRFDIPIEFNVDWVDSDYHHLVRINEGSSGVFNMLNWNTEGANGWGDAFQEEIIAHEAGHMFGQWDEYSGGAVDPITGLINTNGLMHRLDRGTLDYYYDDFFSWYDAALPAVMTTTVPVPVWANFAICLIIIRVSNQRIRGLLAAN